MLVGIAGVNIGYYWFETETNKKVIKLQIEGESLALKGNFAAALQRFKEANTLRPNYEIIQANIESTEEANRLNEMFKDFTKHVEEKRLEKASNVIESIQKKIDNREGILFEKLENELEKKETMLMFYEIKEEIKSLTTISELGNRFILLADFDFKEAEKVKEDIKKKILSISIDQVNQALGAKRFDEASAIVEEALQYLPKDKQLIELQENIKNKKTEYEKQLSETSEPTIEGNEMDLTNLEVEINQNGDALMHGEIKNISTKKMKDIAVYYDVYDGDGRLLTSNVTYLNPSFLQPGETGRFNDTIKGPFEVVTVKVVEVTWYTVE